MTQEELYELLQTMGLPVAYREFKTATPPPFIVYYFLNDDDFKADDQNYVAISDFSIELYTDKKDSALEASLEELLQVNGFVWSKAEAYVEEEHLHMITYDIQLIGGNDGEQS